MLFNSLEFALFLPIVFIIYWIVPHKCRWVVLCISSYFFYMCWNAKYVFLILGITVISYFAAVVISHSGDLRIKRLALYISFFLCLGLLFFFKYFNFALATVSGLFTLLGGNYSFNALDIILPVGISFYTFQALSYVIDVYGGKVSAEKHFGRYAAFISFFPQLVAGPIERTYNLLPQIANERKFSYDQAREGLIRMAWGYYKKMVIADYIAQYVSAVYDKPKSYEGFALVIATFLFSFQIYCDFSGYSDIAIGTAKLLGINLTDNFRSPYFADSIRDFWNRWHISLSSWFRDYVYIPMGGSRRGKIRTYFNVLITFLISGLWHGADWSFVVWGGYHGILNVLERPLGQKIKINIWIRRLITFLLCTFGWIFFVSKNMTDAFYVICNMFKGALSPIEYMRAGFICMDMEKAALIRIVLTILLLAVVDVISLKKNIIEWLVSQKWIIRHSLYWILVFAVIFLGTSGNVEFVYFQF